MIKKFKALFVADIHMTNKLPYSKPTKDGLTDRFEEQLILWDRINKIIREKEVEELFILGDLFDKSLVDAVTLTHTINKIVDCGCVVSILPGNHEASSIRGDRFVVEAFNAMKKNKISVIGLEGYQKINIKLKKNIINFWAVKFMPTYETRDTLKTIRKILNPKEQNILLFHNSVIGSSQSEWICDEGLDPENDFRKFDLVLAGHFHKQQAFGKNGLYLGAPMQLHYGESENTPGFWIFEFDGDSIKQEFIENDFSPRFKIVNGENLETFEDLPLEKFNLKENDYLRFIYEASYSEWSKQKAATKAICDKYKSIGIKASFIHKPIFHHKERLKGEKGLMEVLSLEESVRKYVDAISVTTKGLDSKRLKLLGNEILKMKIEEHGII